MVEATQFLSSVQTRINDTLADKQDALSAMAEQVSARAENLEAIIRSFSSLVDESLKNAESRARQVGKVLAEQTQLTVDAITDQYEAVRNEGSKEHERALDSMRATYRTAIEQAASLFGGVGEGFESAVAELRDATGRIQAEIEATRKELRRGAAELPREAEAATSAMRRIVSDQVKALTELTDIVQRADRRLDVAQPRVTPTPARAERVELRRALPAEPPIERTARGGRDREGWLSELLSRASDETVKAAPRPLRSEAARNETASSGGLDDIANEIGRMIDETALLDAWDRYRQGERTAFSRRLYTLAGQQTFDEIRRRYRRDAEFRETVDQVVEQFDQQMRDIAARDRQGRRANAS